MSGEWTQLETVNLWGPLKHVKRRKRKGVGSWEEKKKKRFLCNLGRDLLLSLDSGTNSTFI